MTDLWLMSPTQQLAAQSMSLYLNSLVLSHVKGLVLSPILPCSYATIRIKLGNDKRRDRQKIITKT